MEYPDIQIGDAAFAATRLQEKRTLRGYGHVEGGATLPGAGDLDVEVPADTTMWIDGTSVQVDDTANTVTLDPHSSEPRWASIVVNSDGSVEAVHGDPAPPLTDPETGQEVRGRGAPRPQPPIISSTTQALHAVVWIDENASEITNEDIVDLRIDARVQAYNLDTSENNSETLESLQVDDVDVNLSSVLNLNAPTDVTGDFSVSGNASVTGRVDLTSSARTTTLDDHDYPTMYRSGNGDDGIHTAHGALMIQPRTSVSVPIRFLTGSPTPAIGLEIEPDQDVAVPNGALAVGGDIRTDSGTTIYDAANAELNGDLINVDTLASDQDLDWTGKHRWVSASNQPVVGDGNKDDWHHSYRDGVDGAKVGLSATTDDALIEGGSGKGARIAVDAASGYDTGTDALTADTGGNVEVPNGYLSITGGPLVGPGSHLSLGASNAEIRLGAEDPNVDRLVVEDGSGNALFTVYKASGDVWTHQGDIRPQGDFNVRTPNDGGYEIQVNGTDAEGVINFKTQ